MAARAAGLTARALLACAFAAALSVGGLALNWPRTAAGGAALLCALFALVVVLLHVPNAFAHPQVFASWNGVAEQLVLTCAGLLAYALVKGSAAPRRLLLRRLGQRAFGVCLIVFGLAHFFYLKFTAAMVPPGYRRRRPSGPQSRGSRTSWLAWRCSAA